MLMTVLTALGAVTGYSIIGAIVFTIEINDRGFFFKIWNKNSKGNEIDLMGMAAFWPIFVGILGFIFLFMIIPFRLMNKLINRKSKTSIPQAKVRR